MTPTPHDALFKTVFSDPPRAAELLQGLLGPQVAARIDWSSLAVEDTSFIDDDLRETHADLLYTARFAGRPCKIHTVFTLLEHMSTSEWSMALRRQIQPSLAGWSDLLREAARAPHGPGASRPIFRYLAQARDAGDHTAILTTAREVINSREDEMYTIADMLMDQGIAKGREQGVREGFVRALKLLPGDPSPTN